MSADSRPRRRLQFGLASLFWLTVAAAVEAWAWRAGQGALVTVLLATGGFVYWRVWVRRYARITAFGLIVLWLAFLYFLLLSFIFFWWMYRGPKVDYSVPITEQKQGVIQEGKR